MRRDVPASAYLAIGCAALYQLLLGASLLLQLDRSSFWSDLVPQGDQRGWQAVGLLQAALALALLLVLFMPRRNRPLVVAAVAIKLIGVVALALLWLQDETQGAALLILCAGELLAAALLWWGLRRIPVRRSEGPSVQAMMAAVAAHKCFAIAHVTLVGLQQSLQSLAAPANVQLSLFPELVSDGNRVAEEFRLFRERVMAGSANLSPQQRQVLERLEVAVTAMLEGDPVIWSPESVRASREWGELRASARRALVAFAWSVDLPMRALRVRRDESIDVERPSA